MGVSTLFFIILSLAAIQTGGLLILHTLGHEYWGLQFCIILKLQNIHFTTNEASFFIKEGILIIFFICVFSVALKIRKDYLGGGVTKTSTLNGL